MALVTLNLKPTDKQLRDFGDLSLAMCNVLGLALYAFSRLSPKGLAIFCLIGLGVYALSRLSTRWVKPIYQALMLAAFPIGWVVSHIVMALFFYGVITPVGLLFRLFGRDPLARRFEPQSDSYWLAVQRQRKPQDYFRQF